jgi:alanine dehydrogenase
MNIGVLKEKKRDENRVALQPFQAGVLVEAGHSVFVETGAGLSSGFSDDEYLKNGAKVLEKQDVLDSVTLILKVKSPLKFEYSDYKPHHTLFTYLHFDENFAPADIMSIVGTGVTAIAYEWVEKDGRYPLLEPMSKLTGYLFAQKSVELCTKYKRKLCGVYESGTNDPATIMIIGIGTIGQSAFKFAMQNNMNIIIVDKHPETLNKRLDDRFGTCSFDYVDKSGAKIIRFDNTTPENTVKAIAEVLPNTDIVICSAVRRPDLPKEKMEYLITKEMVATMKRGSVVADATACDKDLIETSVSTELLDHFDDIGGIVHYSCDHIPSYVGRTATELLTSKTFEYVKKMAGNGIIETIAADESLRKGVMCMNGVFTHKYSAVKKNLAYKDISDGQI